MNIVLPEDLVPVVQRRAEARGFASAEAYIAATLRDPESAVPGSPLCP